VDALLRDALALEVVHARALGDEEHVGDRVGQDAVDLLRHGAVEAAQAGLDVHQRHLELGRHQPAGDGRVHVADDEHGVRPLFQHDRLETLHDHRGLGGVGAAADLEVDVGPGDVQVVEERLAHLVVVVLAGMHQDGGDRGRSAYARISGAIFMKLGRAPQTLMIFTPASLPVGIGVPSSCA
jgi:hypothetical protein